MASKHVASLGKRTAALFIDGMILFAAMLVVRQIVGSQNWIQTYVIMQIVNVCYQIFMLKRFGQTVGKKAVKIKVVGLKNTTLTWEQVVKRVGGLVLPNYVFNLVRLDILSLGWTIAVIVSVCADKEHRGLHDKFAGTKVVAS